MRRIKSRLARVLMVRIVGVIMLAIFIKSVLVVLSDTATPRAVVFVIGMADLVFLFMGVFMTFGKIEVTSDKEKDFDEDEDFRNKEVFSEGYDEGFDEGYHQCLEDREEDEMLRLNTETKIPDRAPDES